MQSRGISAGCQEFPWHPVGIIEDDDDNNDDKVLRLSSPPHLHRTQAGFSLKDWMKHPVRAKIYRMLGRYFQGTFLCKHSLPAIPERPGCHQDPSQSKILSLNAKHLGAAFSSATFKW